MDVGCGQREESVASFEVSKGPVGISKGHYHLLYFSQLGEFLEMHFVYSVLPVTESNLT